VGFFACRTYTWGVTTFLFFGAFSTPSLSLHSSPRYQVLVLAPHLSVFLWVIACINRVPAQMFLPPCGLQRSCWHNPVAPFLHHKLSSNQTQSLMTSRLSTWQIVQSEEHSRNSGPVHCQRLWVSQVGADQNEKRQSLWDTFPLAPQRGKKIVFYFRVITETHCREQFTNRLEIRLKSKTWTLD